MTEDSINERERQLRQFIAQRIEQAHQAFSKEGYSLEAHTAFLKGVDELLNVWSKVKSSLRGDQ